MSNVSDLTLEVLKDIRSELRSINERFDGLTRRFDGLNERVDGLGLRVEGLTDRMENGFAAVNDRLDSVIKIVGTHHAVLESRVRRIEDHLGLPHEA